MKNYELSLTDEKSSNLDRIGGGHLYLSGDNMFVVTTAYVSVTAETVFL
jgi:hypothetical protein